MNGPKRLKKLRALMATKAELKDGRRAKMYVTETDKGIVMCTVVRQSQQIFRGGHATLTDANKAGALCWMMDTTLIGILRDYHGVQYLNTLERETGDLWLSKLDDWEDPEKLFRPTDPAVLMRNSYRSAQLSYLPTRYHLHIPFEKEMIAA